MPCPRLATGQVETLQNHNGQRKLSIAIALAIALLLPSFTPSAPAATPVPPAAPVGQTQPDGSVALLEQDGWAAGGSREPDTRFDHPGWMWPGPPPPRSSRVYFNAVAHFAGAGANPNNAITSSQLYPGGAQGWFAFYGVWADCNGDGYIGLADGSLVYPARLLLDDSTCPHTSGPEGTWTPGAHSYNGWVRELRFIGPADAVGDQDLDGDVSDDAGRYAPGTYQASDVLVWGDYGLPGSPDELCPVAPPQGTTASTGAMIDYVDCHANRRVTNYFNFFNGEAEGWIGPTGLGFENEQTPETSGSLLNQDLPYSLWGNPYQGPGGGSYVPGLLDDGGDEPDPAFTIWDCSESTTVEDEGLVNLPRAPAEGLEGAIGIGSASAALWRDDGSPAYDPTPGDRILTVGDPEPDVDVNPAPILSGEYSYYDSLNHTYDGLADNCETEDDEALAESPEAGAGHSRARRQSDIVFAFQGYSVETLPVQTDLMSLDPVPYDLGLSPIRSSGFDAGWFGKPETVTQPQLIRGDGQPSGAQYATFYAYASPAVIARGFSLPGSVGAYGAEACGDSDSGFRAGWDCDPNKWYRDENGRDIAPRQFYGPQRTSGPPATSPWYPIPRVIAAYPGQAYHLRDVDCFDGSVVEGQPAYVSLQYFTDDNSCADTPGQYDAYWDAVPELDEDFNGLGDTWQSKYKLTKEQAELALQGLGDVPLPPFDADGAGLLTEFKWDTVPIVLNYPNARDFDGDNWIDGDEIRYWDATDDPFVSLMGGLPAGGVAFRDPDSFNDSDGDTIYNQHDRDSDGDRLPDGDEVKTFRTYPEFIDSDCAIEAPLGCTLPQDTKYGDPTRAGAPGSRDGINDADEIAAWERILGSQGYLRNCDPDLDEIPNILDPDSDGDTILDGAEFLAGTDPCENDTPPLPGVPAVPDPTNENLPLLDETNAGYLRDGRVDGTIEATEQLLDPNAVEDLALYLLDEVVALTNDPVGTATSIVPEPIARILDPILYDATSLAPEPPAPESLVETVTRPAWTIADALLATCGLNVLNEVAPDPTKVAGLVADATDCLTALVPSTTPAFPPLTQTTQALLDVPASAITTLTTEVEVASGLVATALDDPLAAVLDAAQPVETLTGELTQPVVEVIPISPSRVNLHPKNLADNLRSVYETIMTLGPDPFGGKEKAVSTVDSLFYNLYLADETAAREWVLLNVPLANASTIDLDNDPSTGVNGADLLMTASLTPAQGIQPPSLEASQTAPTLRVQALSAAARATPLLVCGYHQLPDSSFIAYNCIDTRNATLATVGAPTPSRGFPSTANVTLNAYAFGRASTETKGSYKLESTSEDGSSFPVVALGSIFEVDLTNATKPRIDNGDHVDLAIHATQAHGSAQFDLRRLDDPAAGGSSEWSWTNSMSGRVTGSYHLTRDARTLDASSAATSPPASLAIKSVRNAQDTTLTVTTTVVPASSAAATTFALVDQAGSSPEAFSLAASELPASVSLQADDATGKLTLTTQLGSPRDLRVVAMNDRERCPAAVAGDHVTRQPIDSEGGACLALRLRNPLTALDLTLASGGPSLSLASASAKRAPISILLRPGSQSPRSIDATLSNIPTSLTLASTLAAPDGSTTLAWSSSEEVEDARIVAKSGSTILVWNGTNVPTAAQASFAWATDVLTVETSAPNEGTIELLLTNTGSVPTLPEADHLAGIYVPGKAPSIAAAARLSGVSLARATLATESFHVETTESAGRPFGVRYARGAAPAFTLDVGALPAEFDLQALAQEDATHRIDYTGAAGIALEWIGNFPGGAHVEAAIEDAPATFSLLATPTSGMASLDASETLGRLSALRTSTASDAMTLAGDDVIHLQAAPDAPDTYRVSLRETSELTFSKSAGTLSITRSGTAERGLRAQVGDDATFASASFSVLPASTLVQYSRTGVEYEASASTPPDLDLSISENGDALTFAGRALPTQASLAWTSTTQTTALSATHDGTRIPLLAFEGAFAAVDGSLASEYVHLRLENSPPTVSLSFDAATDEIGASAPGGAGLVEYWHAANAETIDVPNEPYYLLMSQGTQGGAGAFEVFRLANLREAVLQLGSGAGQDNRLFLDADANGGFYAEYRSSLGDSLRARLSNVPSNVDLRYALGADQGSSLNGMTFDGTGGGPITSLSLHAEQADLALTLATENVPTDWNGTWAPGQPLDLRANAPMAITGLALRPADEEPSAVAGAASHLLIDGRDATKPRLGAAFPTGMRRAYSDSTQHEIRMAFGASPAEFRLIHREPEMTTSLDAAVPATSFALRAPPVEVDPANLGGVQARFHWDANGASSGIAWALDAPGVRWRWSADGAPPTARATLDTTLGTFVASAPTASTGGFRLQYTSDANQPFYGEGAGLVILANPTGPEMPAANLTTFTLDLPQLSSVNASYLGTSSSKNANGGTMVELRRANGAPPTPIAIHVAAGAEALRFAAEDAASFLATEWATSATDGLAADVTTDGVLANAVATYRGSEGVVQAAFGSIENFLDLRIRPKDAGQGLDPRVQMDYATAGASPRVEVFADAAGALANLTLLDAPSEFHVDAPLQGSTTGATGRAWTTPDMSAGRAHLVLVPRDAATVAAIDEPRYFDAAFEPTAATVQMELANLRSATWTSDPVNGRLRLVLETTASENATLRALFRNNDDQLVLDATANATPAALHLDAEAGLDDARISWQSATAGIDVHAAYLAPASFVDATLTDAPADWSLAADALGNAPLLYGASGNATSLAATTGTTTFGASIDATDVPAALAWNVPVVTCPSPTVASVATISTLGTGSVGMLRAATLPGGSGDAGVADEGERATYTCDDNGPTTSIRLSGFESVTWERIAAEDGTSLHLRLPALPTLPIAIGASVAPVDTLFQLPRIPTPASTTNTPAGPTMGPPPLASLARSPHALIPAPYAITSDRSPATTWLAAEVTLGPDTPLVIGTTLGTDGTATLTGQRIDLQRDSTKTDPDADVRLIRKLVDGQTLDTTARAPVSSLDITRTMDTGLAKATLRHDGVRPASVDTYYAWGTGSDTVRFDGPPEEADVTLEATGDNFVFDYTASAAAGDAANDVPGGLRLRSNAAGPAVLVEATAPLPPRIRGLVSGSQGGDCSGANGPYSANFSTEGAGEVGNLVVGISDSGAAPTVASGAVLNCQGATRTFAANVPNMRNLELTGGPCVKKFVVPADSTTTQPYGIDTPAFTVQLRVRMRDGAAALVGTLGNDHFNLSSEAVGSGILDAFKFDFERKGELPTGAATSAPCLTFGDGSIQKIGLDAPGLSANLTTTFGKDALGLQRLSLVGPGADSLYGVVVRYPPPEDPSAVASTDDPRGLDLNIRLPIRDIAKIEYGEVESTPPGPPIGAEEDNYAAIAVGGVMRGGRIQLLGFENASLTFDRTKLQNEMKTHAKIGYHGVQQPAPLSVEIIGEDDLGINIDATQLPNADAEFTYYAGTAYELTRLKAAYEGSPTTFTIHETQPQTASMELVLDLPSKVTNLEFELDRNPSDDPEITLDLWADASTGIAMTRRDESGLMEVSLDRLPSTLVNGKLTLVSCGVEAKMLLGEPIARIDVLFEPTEGGGDSPAPHVSPGCPVPNGPPTGAEDGVTRLEATVEGIPAGPLDLKFHSGKAAGEVLLAPLGAPVSSIVVFVTTTGSDSSRVHVDAKDVTLRTVQWDIDGHTDMPGMPKAVFLDSAGVTTGRIILEVQGGDPLHVDSNGRVYFRGFQFKLVDWASWTPGQRPLELHAAGCMKLLDDNLEVRMGGWEAVATWAYLIAKQKDWRCW